ncbi:MAG: hypothetical protein AB7D02_00170 [Candidatus Paceibacterota bacterium]
MSKSKKKKIIDIYPKSKKEESLKDFELEAKEEVSEISEEIEKEPFFQKLAEELNEKKEESETIEDFNIDLKPLKREIVSIRKKSYKKVVTFLLGISLIVLLYYFSIFNFSKAEINIKRKREVQQINQTVLFDKNIKEINSEKLLLPLNFYVFQEKASKQFSSTGFGRDERKATGEVTLYNLTPYSQVLVATTRLETPDGKIFRINSRIIIPGAVLENNETVPGSIKVKVTADQAGPDYNIGPCNPSTNCQFKIVGFKGTEKYDKFYGYSEKEMTGGSYGTIPLVTNEDLKKAEEAILDEVVRLIEADIKNKVPQGLKIIEGAKSGFKVTNLESDAKAGDSRQFFNVSAEGEVMVGAFNEKDVKNLLKQLLQKNLNDQQEFCDDFELKYALKEIDFKSGTMKVDISGKAFICQKISSSEILNLVKNEDIETIEETLKNYPYIEKALLKITPFWVKRVPSSEKRIVINID